MFYSFSIISADAFGPEKPEREEHATMILGQEIRINCVVVYKYVRARGTNKYFQNA